MKIIDKNIGFYDYLQSIYPDNAVTFNRHDSRILSKENLLLFSEIIRYN